MLLQSLLYSDTELAFSKLASLFQLFEGIEAVTNIKTVRVCRRTHRNRKRRVLNRLDGLWYFFTGFRLDGTVATAFAISLLAPYAVGGGLFASTSVMSTRRGSRAGASCTTAKTWASHVGMFLLSATIYRALFSLWMAFGHAGRSTPLLKTTAFFTAFLTFRRGTVWMYCL